MNRCFTRFTISGLGEPYIYHDLGVFYKEVGILLGGCLTVKNWWGFLKGVSAFFKTKWHKSGAI